MSWPLANRENRYIQGKRPSHTCHFNNLETMLVQVAEHVLWCSSEPDFCLWPCDQDFVVGIISWYKQGDQDVVKYWDIEMKNAIDSPLYSELCEKPRKELCDEIAQNPQRFIDELQIRVIHSI